jgi:hypothetical protein
MNCVSHSYIVGKGIIEFIHNFISCSAQGKQRESGGVRAEFLHFRMSQRWLGFGSQIMIPLA